MSGILGQLAGLFGGGQSASATEIASMVGNLVSSQGGLQGLVSRLEQAGLGEQVQSWIGTGANHPVSGEALGAALPQDYVEGWAARLGVSPDQVLATLSHVLPHAVDQATPAGQISPGETAIPDLATLAGRLFGG